MDGCMRSAGVPARHRPRGGDDSTRHRFASASPRHQLPFPAIVGFQRPARNMGPALAGARHAGRDAMTDPPICSTPRSGSAGRHRWSWRSAAEREPRRWRWPRLNRISTWSPSRCTGADWPSCSARSTREGVTNIRLVRGDGVDVLEHMFGPESLTGVRVFFPDPWPKARHHKRRLLQPDTVALIADRLRPGGVLHAATDHAGYAEQIAECGDAEPRLRRVTADEGCPSRWRGRSPSTRRRRATQAARSRNCSGRSCDERLREEPRTAREHHRRNRRGAAAWRPERIASCWSGTHPTSTWASAPSWAAGRPPRTAPDSTRSAAGCWPAPRSWPPARRGRVALEPEATVFTNIAPGSADVVRPWVEALRNVGFAVFAKPKIDEDSDVDVDMLNHIALRRSEGLAGAAGGLRRRAGVPPTVGGHRPRRHPRPSARISRTRKLGASLGYFGVRRPGGHPWCLPGAATANRPRFAARAGRLAAAVPAAVLATDVARVNN